MEVSLRQVLDLVGNLDDSPGENTPRERFRQFLQTNVTQIGQVRDYIEECLRTSGDKYSRALQDLLNHLGRFLRFDVVFGRYQGVQGQIGFDGHWKSPAGFDVVVEVKTTEVYAIKTATLLHYINELVSNKSVADPEKVLGLYIVGRPDPEIRQLENAIIAERKTQQLRIISANSLLSIAEMMNEYEIAHEDRRRSPIRQFELLNCFPGFSGSANPNFTSTDQSLLMRNSEAGWKRSGVVIPRPHGHGTCKELAG
jgi:hypothetical protein